MITRLQIQQNLFSITIILMLLSLLCGGSYYYIFQTQHCQFDGDGSYSCDVFASSKEKQKMCVEDSLMNSPNQGVTGYNADTGKTYMLSETEKKNEYDFIVGMCEDEN